MMVRGVRIAYGSVRAMDLSIRIHVLLADIWAATKILFQTPVEIFDSFTFDQRFEVGEFKNPLYVNV